ncbi:hypothetical protein VB547_19735 [Vibrio parahaemolyticus]|uniref:type IV CRISPR-associated DEAD/DEAH-box helicase Csf4 n=3 Tax=Gammaproteobacteria TaxID=1236 RepID=UPI002ABB9067|nr:type IV CRISPR-associated DEAD/DEAH-box helicase Csf4 [Vibrio parahaemolyticus]MDZ3971793.1 hypothetical protein [Escherichia coli]MEA5303673.1 hypothetical protein [Vibrio parahaemolyticus]
MAKVKIPQQLAQALLPDNTEDILSKDDQKKVADVAKKIIVDAIERGLGPKMDAQSDEGSVAFHYNLTFPQQVSAKIRTLMREHKQPEGLLLFYILSAGIEKELYVNHQLTSEESEHMMDVYLNPLAMRPRKEQLILADAINDTLAKGGIGMVEGGTGIGKTLTILASANQIAAAKGQRSVIATNTISNIQQMAKTYERLVAAGVEMVPLRVVLGRNSFVSVDKLRRYLADDEIPQEVLHAVERWMQTGLLQEREIDAAPAYLLDELVSLFPNAATSEVVLGVDASSEDPGYLAYKSQFVREDVYPEIVLCTHAMLAIDAKTRRIRIAQSEHDLTDELKATKRDISSRIEALGKATDEAKRILKEDIDELQRREDLLSKEVYQNNDIGLLPMYQFLFVDEAHLLEETASRMISDNLSFRSFIKELESHSNAGIIPAGKMKDIKKEASIIINADDQDKEAGKVSLTPGVEYFHALSRIVNLVKSTKNYRKLPGSLKAQIRTLQYAIDKADSPHYHFGLTFSPVKRYPQIISGEINTQPYMRTIWQQVSAAICISATLYFPKMGGFTCSYFANNLFIPERRLKTYTPITPPWLKSNVHEICLPPLALEQAERFVPVGRKQSDETTESREKMHSAWLDNIAEQIVIAHGQGEGGTLVLMTSFADVRGVYDRLGGLNNPIVKADGNVTTEAQKVAYLNALKAGEKPLWLALGGAWTGLDINGKHIGLSDEEIAEKDNVIATLIIPKLPFGLNRSLSYHARLARSRKQGAMEVMETVIRFKQGLGRLIRLENQPKNRRILVLDGRLRMPEYKGFLGPIMRVIESYPRVRPIY